MTHLRRRLLAAPVVALVLVLAVSACSSSSSTPTASKSATAQVVAKDFSLTSATVKAGAQVTFANHGQQDHTMTADDGSFDSGHVAPGQQQQVTAPTKPGTYSFHCSIHPQMTGKLTVQ